MVFIIKTVYALGRKKKKKKKKEKKKKKRGKGKKDTHVAKAGFSLSAIEEQYDREW